MAKVDFLKFIKSFYKNMTEKLTCIKVPDNQKTEWDAD